MTSCGPGESCLAQLRLTEPVAVKQEDRFVIRFYSPVETIGGGTVLDPRPLRHKRHDLAVLDSLILREQGSGSQRLLQAAEEFGVSLPDSSQLAERSGLDTGTAVSLLADLLNQGKLAEPLPGRYAAASALDTLWDRGRELLSAYHQKHPLHAGMPAR